MKVVYEDGEKDRLKKVYDAFEHEMGGTLFEVDDLEKVYGITFKITKPEIASYVLLGLLNNKLDDFDIGIDVQSIEFDIIQKSGSWYSYNGEKIAQGKDNVKIFLQSNEEIYETIKEQIRERLQNL